MVLKAGQQESLHCFQDIFMMDKIYSMVSMSQFDSFVLFALFLLLVHVTRNCI